MDVCQSVLGQFFIQAVHGEFAMENPTDLIKVQVTIARNRLRDQVHRQHVELRDQPREATACEVLDGEPVGKATPSRILAGREVLNLAQEGLTVDEVYLVKQRAMGREWADLAAELGCEPGALRMRLRRALNRVIDQPGSRGSCLY